MFKKSLVVGALATALIGGIGTANAHLSPCPNQNIGYNGLAYTRYVVNPDNNFASVFTQMHNGINITWHLKGVVKPCLYNGRKAYSAYYEGT
ncbi:hypothetical protein GPY51_17220 [Photorhabdus laumondii subsp. laumondii]|uniref:Photorhabdus luminescens subsp. laumondii TTO1 complete genome segment 11/17 n=2 Tax=Photorhabdus laumondii subsp. laumondii TaxID=141679 RepID=Q7N2F1_PHOLL|nr:hypothetical protein [Photorhabdus laumondii]AXG48143.1 hypothetical protein PluTT01m_16100 [Photorhabdus laumondii subsp. laumondii]MCC8384726.1 hypothetical protein [Photorhabdus laumondii]MCC8414973.1 hypothetical protein [Photorhabdus laumondii]NDK96067.1 hypothetical protein [Photorhabdus laumondii subsp. laumondii]NDL22315.1 hypothetical protein [Photorhabdus laumondii subsp. laumondii]